MSIAVLAIVGVLISMVMIGFGLRKVVSERSTLVVETTSGLRTRGSVSAAGAKGAMFLGKQVAFRRQGSISAVEVGELRAQGETALPRAVAVLVVGFGLLLLSIGALLAQADTDNPLLLVCAAVFGFSGLSLPIGWFRKEQEAKAEALHR